MAAITLTYSTPDPPVRVAMLGTAGLAQQVVARTFSGLRLRAMIQRVSL